ncbi:MAG: hypothetical protein HZC41_26840 [Chloroflexi bacterium]|nr:hypothetical protein [Chloroflexota bacterium]
MGKNKLRLILAVTIILSIIVALLDPHFSSGTGIPGTVCVSAFILLIIPLELFGIHTKPKKTNPTSVTRSYTQYKPPSLEERMEELEDEIEEMRNNNPWMY